MSSEPQQIAQYSTLPPAQPSYVFRGHLAQIHGVHFLKKNLRLLTGDADGWVVFWSLTVRRPVAVWRAHSSSVLGLGSWGDDKILTHGRDSKLHVWQLREEDESTFSTILPIEDSASDRKQPWLLHTLTVNTLNFCSFAMCQYEGHEAAPTFSDNIGSRNILVATPGVQDGYVNVTGLPSEDRVATIPSPKDTSTGMVMAIGLHYYDGRLNILAGYESGHASLWQQDVSTRKWQVQYLNKSHTQPIMSLGIARGLKCFFTTSADAMIARHPLTSDVSGTKTVQTKHAGQQSITVRSDEKIFATAGWDGRVRVYTPKSMKELAVLKWHKDGCYALAFAELLEKTGEQKQEVDDDGQLVKLQLTVSEQRTAKAKSTHWLAAGSKDGKVSLWDIY